MTKEQARANSFAIATALEGLFAIPAAVEGLKAEIAELRRQISVLQAVQPLAIVTVPEAAERLGVTQRTVRRMLLDGRLKSVRIGNRVRVDLATIQSSLLLTADDIIGDESKRAA